MIDPDDHGDPDYPDEHDDPNDPDYSDEYKLTPTNGATFGLLSFTQATTYVCAPWSEWVSNGGLDGGCKWASVSGWVSSSLRGCLPAKLNPTSRRKFQCGRCY